MKGINLKFAFRRCLDGCQIATLLPSLTCYKYTADICSIKLFVTDTTYEFIWYTCNLSILHVKFHVNLRYNGPQALIRAVYPLAYQDALNIFANLFVAMLFSTYMQLIDL